MAKGLIRWTTPDGTVDLVVYGDHVVDCPPVADSWARGARARELWRDLAARCRVAPDRYRLVWIPDPPSPDDPPTRCRRGHRFGPNLVNLSWVFCSCPGASGGGHHTYHCRHLVDGVLCGDEQVHGHVEAG